MTGRSPARLLAPLALVVTAVALFAVVTSGEGEKGGDSGGSATPTSTTTTTKAKGKQDKAKARTKRYTVQPGDTPSGIAEKLDVSLEDLLAANPEADPNALSPGQKLKLP